MRRIAVFAATAMLSLLLFGCSGADGKNDTTKKTTVTTTRTEMTTQSPTSVTTPTGMTTAVNG